MLVMYMQGPRRVWSAALGISGVVSRRGEVPRWGDAFSIKP